jgi:hypothetical protein
MEKPDAIPFKSGAGQSLEGLDSLEEQTDLPVRRTGP